MQGGLATRKLSVCLSNTWIVGKTKARYVRIFISYDSFLRRRMFGGGDHRKPVCCRFIFPLSFIPPPRDTSVLSRLRTATRFLRPVSRTKKYCSFIIYALNHYQVPSCNSYSGLDPSLHFVCLLCCLGLPGTCF